MIQNTQKQYFLFDSSKYNKRFAFKICSAGDVTGIITDLDDVSFQQNHKQSGVCRP